MLSRPSNRGNSFAPGLAYQSVARRLHYYMRIDCPNCIVSWAMYLIGIESTAALLDPADTNDFAGSIILILRKIASSLHIQNQGTIKITNPLEVLFATTAFAIFILGIIGWTNTRSH